jgi:hypothetical protein
MIRKAFMIIVTLVAIIACEKSGDTAENEWKNEILAKSSTSDIKVLSYCDGTCNTPENCESIKDMVNKKYYCSCESDNCSRIVEIFYGPNAEPTKLSGDAAINFLDDFVQDKYLFFDELDSHIESIHNQLNYRLDQIGFLQNENGYIVHYFYTTQSGIQETVVFIYSSLNGKKLKVNCNGHCDVSTQKCVEEYGFDSGKVNCSCQSDNCYMTVEEIGEIGG